MDIRKKRKKFRVKAGDFFAVPLSDGEFTFGRALEDYKVAFYDGKNKNLLNIDEIEKLPVMFKIYINLIPVKTGDWPKLGYKPLSEELKKPVKFFKIGPFNKSITIYWETSDKEYDVPATYEECKDLEVCAVYGYEHVLERLEDHYAGKEYSFVRESREELKAARDALLKEKKDEN